MDANDDALTSLAPLAGCHLVPKMRRTEGGCVVPWLALSARRGGPPWKRTETTVDVGSGTATFIRL